MGKFDLGINLAKEVSAYVRTSGRSLLQTRPIGKINLEGLRYAPQLERDVVQIAKNDYLANIKRLGLNEKDSKMLEDLLADSSWFPEETKELREMFNRVTNRSDIDLNELRKLFTGKEHLSAFSKKLVHSNKALNSEEKLYTILERLQTSQPKDLEIIKLCNDEEALEVFLAKNDLGEYILPNQYIKKLSEMSEKQPINTSYIYSRKLGREVIEGNSCKTIFSFDPKSGVLEFIEENGSKQIKTVRNMNGNETVSKINPQNGERIEILKERIYLRDASGNPTEFIKYKKSDIDGIFNVVKKDLKTGKEVPLSEVFIDSTGTKIARQNLVSPNGTKTRANYEEMPNGNSQYTYKIVDKNNNTLLEQTRSRTVISDSEFLHTINDKNYNVKFLGSDKIEILNTDTKQLDVIDLKGLLSELTGAEKAEAIAMLKRVPADELLALNKFEIKQLSMVNINEASTMIGAGSIQSNPNEFVFLHELGHQKDMIKNVFSNNEKNIIDGIGKSLPEMQIELGDYLMVLSKQLDVSKKTKISRNPDLLKIYEKERNAYISRFGAEDKRIDYFINTPGLALGYQGEAIAEINALLSTPKSEALLGTRSYLLAENFPETIAYASKLLS